ncbi:MAG: hypothetical protein AAFQ94_12660 [Bacteroidota bacterium]
MYKYLLTGISIIAIAAMVSCSSDNELIEQDFGFEYFPLEIGDFREYSVTEVNFLTVGPDTSRYFIREEITDSVTNGGVVLFTLERSSRTLSTDPWKVDSLWTARVDCFEAIQVENNIPILKIQFPVADGKVWDSNLFNALDSIGYTSFLIDSDTLDDQVLKVEVANLPQNLVGRDERNEFYARGIGLINRDFITLKFDTSNGVATNDIESGRVLMQKLINYGKN